MNDIDYLKTNLENRVLCYDGDSIANLSLLYDYILEGENASDLYISKNDYKTDEVLYYNKHFPNDKIDYKKNFKSLSKEWNIPDEYKNLDIEKYIKKQFKEEIKTRNFSDDELKKRYYRIKMELRAWESRDLLNMFKTLVYIVHTFKENNVVWGTGRGSSCASYLLYLIGLHQVDSVEYDLDIGEFFR